MILCTVRTPTFKNAKNVEVDVLSKFAFGLRVKNTVGLVKTFMLSIKGRFDLSEDFPNNVLSRSDLKLDSHPHSDPKCLLKRGILQRLISFESNGI